ncbi:MAG TPA: ketopantoate reductase family protein [Stellaceae bacterium]|nr:ketopantoate reductase family protein [Stellaceae bacterium]
MRILVLGAGAIGGYFGGRLAEAGADVTFLVRARRKAELDKGGLIVKSATGDISLRPKTLAAGGAAAPFDVVLLSCKSYDLASAIEAVAPYMANDSAVVPLLNGLRHLDTLADALGRERVMGGACYIGATLDGEGVVRHIGELQALSFGELSGERTARAEALLAQFARTKAQASIPPSILQSMWEKFVMLAALAAATTLTRATVGELMAAPSGEAFALRALAECTAVATAAGHAPGASSMTQSRTLLTTRGSPFAASTMRDMLAGRRTEGDHIVGDMMRRGAALGVAVPILAAALTNLEVHEARLARG